MIKLVSYKAEQKRIGRISGERKEEKESGCAGYARETLMRSDITYRVKITKPHIIYQA